MYGVDYTLITTQRNVTDFNSIRETVAGITDATEEKQYVVLVPDGEWFECDLVGKKWVHIVGQSRSGAIIYNDGLSTKLTPADYSFASEANKPLNTISNMYKHTVNVLDDCLFQNITIQSIGCKYVIHIDNDSSMNLTDFHKCKIKVAHDYHRPCVGIGSWGMTHSQTMQFRGCDFKTVRLLDYGIFFHNWNNQNHPTHLMVSDCTFKNCGMVLMQELGSNQNDIVTIVRSSSDYLAQVFWGADKAYWLDEFGQPAVDEEDLPYSIKLHTDGVSIDTIYPWNSWQAGIPSRSQYEDYITII